MQFSGAMTSQRRAWIIDQVGKPEVSRANHQAISHDRSFVAWPVKLHRDNLSTNRQSLLTRTTTLVTLYYLTRFFPGKAFPARVSGEALAGLEAVAAGSLFTPRRIVLEFHTDQAYGLCAVLKPIV